MIEPLEIPDIDLNFDHRIEITELQEKIKVSDSKNKTITNVLIVIGVGLFLGWIGVEIHSLYKMNGENKNKI